MFQTKIAALRARVKQISGFGHRSASSPFVIGRKFDVEDLVFAEFRVFMPRTLPFVPTLWCL